MGVSASNSTGGYLVRATVRPFPRENLSVRATMVDMTDNAGVQKVNSGVRLRTSHLIAADAASSRKFRAGVKDVNDVWSEWSPTITLTPVAFSSGATEGSIGSGHNDDLYIEEPALNFPDLSMGSGQVWMHRTLVGGGFNDEQRRSKWATERSAFNVILMDLDEDQTLLMHRFFRALNGPLTPFWFEYTDPNNDVTSRYVVRFREPELSAELFAVERSWMEFTLIELIGASAGGDV